MDKIHKGLVLKEIKNFKQISKEYKYRDINELIGHYIEEGIISSKEELIKVAVLIKNELKVNINRKNFEDCWAN